MKNTQQFEVAVIGGASAGLSAALSLGRSLRKVVVFDTSEPRNKPVTHAHNMFTRDGIPPSELLAIGREQLKTYSSVVFRQERVIKAAPEEGKFRLETAGGEVYIVRKIILATGVKDILPEIPGVQALWGNKVIHCPYCHGWEVRDAPVALIGNDEIAYHLTALVYNLNKDLSIFTNGKSTFTAEQQAKLQEKGIAVIETPIAAVEDDKDGIRIILTDGNSHHKQAAYLRIAKLQFHNDLAIQLGCELEEVGSIKVDEFQQTSVPGVLAAGDIAHPMFHQLVLAASSGNKAGALCNKQLSAEDFEK